MKRVLVVSPTRYDFLELSTDEIKADYSIVFYNIYDEKNERIVCPGIGWITENFNSQYIINELDDVVQKQKFDAIVSAEDYPGSVFVSIVAQRNRLNAPSAQAVLTCQQKYCSRLAQYVHVPEATPGFQLIQINRLQRDAIVLEFPIFTKPVKSVGFSIFANHVSTYEQLELLAAKSCLPSVFIDQFNWFLRDYQLALIEHDHLLVEDMLSGQQSTLEVFVYNKSVYIVGIVDSVLFENRISFKRFEYPSNLSESVQKRMADIARRFLLGIGYDNGFCNIEFMYDPKNDDLKIIEVNSRMCSQFADLFQKVDGNNTYKILLDIAAGTQPELKKNEGSHKKSASLVLRTFENKKVIKSPGQKELDKIYALFPDARVHLMVKAGDSLSDTFQDGKSFRYGLVHLGGRDMKDILQKFEECKKILNFEFSVY